MIEEPKVYFKGIEKKLIEFISSAESSVRIAMAWFTNRDIKESLIELKKSNPKIIIEIVVDKNYVNDKYFSNTQADFEEIGIIIKQNLTRKFLHHKFLIIDERIVITGSFNFSKKANSNLENIIVTKSKDLSDYFYRLFKFITAENFQDENIELLFEFPKFAQSIISTYYQFTRKEYNKYKEKIEDGECYTYENGFGDCLYYHPGLVFNEKVKYNKEITSEFSIPIDKELIKMWIESQNMHSILDFYRDKEELHHLINDELEQNSSNVKESFKRKIEKIASYAELKRLIESDVNIIIEDDLWLMNFEPFMNKEIIERIFEKIKPIEKNWWQHRV